MKPNMYHFLFLCFFGMTGPLNQAKNRRKSALLSPDFHIVVIARPWAFPSLAASTLLQISFWEDHVLSSRIEDAAEKNHCTSFVSRVCSLSCLHFEPAIFPGVIIFAFACVFSRNECGLRYIFFGLKFSSLWNALFLRCCFHDTKTEYVFLQPEPQRHAAWKVTVALTL